MTIIEALLGATILTVGSIILCGILLAPIAFVMWLKPKHEVFWVSIAAVVGMILCLTTIGLMIP
jgi:ABC-type Fe3+-siderophore transport system permease subunit